MKDLVQEILNNPEYFEVLYEIRTAALDPIVNEKIWIRHKAKLDEASRMHFSNKLAEEKGYQKGLELGRKEYRVEFVKNCLKNGFTYEQIALFMDRTEEEVIELSKKITNKKEENEII